MKVLFFLIIPICTFAAESEVELLSRTGLYDDIINKIVNPKNRFFAPQYPLWTDGALKNRWINLPVGTKIDTSDLDNWNFPSGTRLWKEFSFKREDGAIKRIETRLMEKLSDGSWKFSTYLWNEGETEGTLAPENGVPNFYQINEKVTFDIPSRKACIFCHQQNGTDPVLGFSALQISPLRDTEAIHGTPLTSEMTTLETLQSNDLVTNKVLTWPQVVDSEENPLQKRIFGYFHGNCASCHNPKGSVPLLNLKHKVETQFSDEEVSYKSTIGKLTQVYKIPNIPDGETFYIQPGNPDASAILFRMKATDLHRMPVIGTKIIDHIAVDALENYIRNFVRGN